MLTRGLITLEEHRAQERRRKAFRERERALLEQCNRALQAKQPRFGIEVHTGVRVTLRRWWDASHVLSEALFRLIGGHSRPKGLWREWAPRAVVPVCTCENAEYWREPVTSIRCACQMGDEDFEAYLSTITAEDYTVDDEDYGGFVSTSLLKMVRRSFATVKEDADRLARVALAKGAAPPRLPKSVSMAGYLKWMWKNGIVEPQRPRKEWDDRRQRALRVQRLLREWRILQEIWTVERQTRNVVPRVERRRMLRAGTRGLKKQKQLNRAQQKLIEEMPKAEVELLSGECKEIPMVVFQQAFRWGPNVKGGPPRHHGWYDMLSAGEVGVVEAALHFDPNFGDGNVPFAGFARSYVHAEIFKVLNDRQVHVPLNRMKGGGWRNYRENLDSFSDAPKEQSSDSVLVNGLVLGNEDPYGRGGGSRGDGYIKAAREDSEPLGEEYQLFVTGDAEAVEDVQAETVRRRLKEFGLTPREIQAFELRYNVEGKGLGPNPSFELIGARMGIQTRSAWNYVHRGWEKLNKANGKKPLFAMSSLDYWRGGEQNRPAFEIAVLSKVDEERGKPSEPLFFATDEPAKPNNGHIYGCDEIRWFMYWRWERPDKSETLREGLEEVRRHLDCGPLFAANDPEYDAAELEWERKPPEYTGKTVLAAVQVEGREVEITEQTFLRMFMLAFLGEEQKHRESISIIQAEDARWQERAKEGAELERVVLGDEDIELIDTPLTVADLGVCDCDDAGCGICNPPKEQSIEEMIQDVIEEVKVEA